MPSKPSTWSMLGSFPAVWILALALLAGVAPATAAEEAPDEPFERTEDRKQCASYDPLRQTFFGTTHLHTGRSFDAAIRFVPNGPADAYAFARGEAPIKGADPTGRPTREYFIDRPLDWGAVTDHSEHFGEVGICQSTNKKGHDSLDCQLINGFYWQAGVGLPPGSQRSTASQAFTILVSPGLGPSDLNTRMPMCNSGEADCRASELEVWQEMQQAAADAYDHAPRCKFTSFVGYEMSAAPSGTNWHRTVIFRNADVIERPVSALDLTEHRNTTPNKTPPVYNNPTFRIDKLWKMLDEECISAEGDCDVITIPHNSNLGGGVGKDGSIVPAMLFDPTSTENAEFQHKVERLVEIYQNKGSSECRWDPRYGRGVGTTDEHCDFELLDSLSLTSASGVGTGSSAAAVPPRAFDERSFVRNVLKDGLTLMDRYGGVNPFEFGIVAASDSHNGTMGWHPENASFGGHEGIEDAIPVNSGSNIQNGTGGFGVVWAEENSRDAIFEALKRKETYGTSGTRPVVRVFGGWDLEDTCERPAQDMAAKGYAEGVPMGGNLLDASSTEGRGPGAKPSFVVSAWKDDFIDTPLQQIQMVKGWVDGEGNTQEKVWTIAGSNPQQYEEDSGGKLVARPLVDPETCQSLVAGKPRLCSHWTDDDFDPKQKAFYYVRVLEDPVCRWSTHWCREHLQIDPLSPSCSDDLAKLQKSLDPAEKLRGETGTFCCNNQQSDVFLQPVIQERAWTSPIWYVPRSDDSAGAYGGAQ